MFSKLVSGLLNEADTKTEFKNDDVGEYVLYVFDWVKWYEEYPNIIELYQYLNSLPLVDDNEQCQLIVYSNEDRVEIIEKGYYGFGLSVGIQHNP